MLYSRSTGGFYREDIHGANIPDDALPVSQERYNSVIANPTPGKVLSHDSDGLPILIDPPPPLPLTLKQVEAERLRAYADPITGSDRYFSEAQRETLMGNPDAADAAKALGMARFAEIKAEHPWPAE